jgi:RNA polymerase sigma factor (sigma-70 family)
MVSGQLVNFLDRVGLAGLLPDGERTDGQLLGRYLQRRDPAAFEALVRRHGGMVLGVCKRILGHDQDAEDAFQATWLVFVRKAGTIAPPEKVGNWLHGVATRTARRARSRSYRRARERQVAHLPERAAEPEEHQGDLRALLDGELGRLPERYRVPVILCDLEGRRRKEVARQLGWPEGTLSGRLARARALLARRLARFGLGVSCGALAVELSCQAASAGVPGPLVAATVKLGTMVSSGQAAGLIPAPVAALTMGVVKAMLLNKVKSAGVLLLVGLLGAGAVALPAWVLAARGPTAAPALPPPQVRGVVKAVNNGKAIVVNVRQGGKDVPQAFALPKEVPVVIAGKAANPAALKAGMPVGLQLSRDRKRVVRVLADAGERNQKDDGQKNNKDDGDKGNKEDGQKNQKDDGQKGNKDDGDKNNKDDGQKNNKEGKKGGK